MATIILGRPVGGEGARWVELRRELLDRNVPPDPCLWVRLLALSADRPGRGLIPMTVWVAPLRGCVLYASPGDRIEVTDDAPAQWGGR